MTRFGYFRATVPGFKRHGYITVAMERPAKGVEPQTHIAAFSFCSPLDTFRKGQGRMIAERRLSHQRTVKVSFEYTGGIKDAFKIALDKLFTENFDYVPKWLKTVQFETIQFGTTELQPAPAAEEQVRSVA